MVALVRLTSCVVVRFLFCVVSHSWEVGKAGICIPI